MAKKPRQCEECRKPKAKWRCPKCGCELCDECRDMYEGQCDICAPYFEKIGNRKKKNA